VSVDVTATDAGDPGLSLTETFVISVINVNENAPVGNDDSIAVDEGGTATLLVGGADSVLANDTDADLPGDTLAVDTTPVSGPTYGTLTLNTNGTLIYTHDGSENFTDSFTYRVVDGNGLDDTATVNITITPVNDNGPSDIQLVNAVLDANGNVSVDENTPDGTFIADIQIIDADGDEGYTITLVDDGGGAFGLGSIMVADGGLLDYETASNRQVTVRVTDTNGLSMDKTFTIAVNNIDEPLDIIPPVIASTPVGTVSTSSATGPDTGDFSPDTTSTAEHVRDTIVDNQSATESVTELLQSDIIGEPGELAVLLSGDPTQVFDAPAAGAEGDPEAVSEDGQATDQEAGDDPSAASAEGDAPQEAEGRTPLTQDIKKQSEQFEMQRKDILELFEDFGQKMGCSG
jgi:VCBS repeat-containing protein